MKLYSKPHYNFMYNKTIFISKSEWLEVFGLSPFLDTLFAFLLTPISFIGFLLNLFTLFILIQKEFYEAPIFNFFRVYTINSAILDLILTTFVIIPTYKLIEIFDSNEAYIYGAYIYISLFSTLYFFNSFLDIFIILERLSYFVPKMVILKKYSWKCTCIAIFSLCLVINFPFLFVFQPENYIVILDSYRLYQITSWDVAKWGASSTGTTIVFIIYFVRDILTLISEIILNIISIVLLKRHLSKKRDLISTEALKRAGNDLKDLSKAEKNLIFMVITKCFLSVMEHMFFIACNTYFLMSQEVLSYSICFASHLSTAIKHASNFFVFILFNKLFRNAFKKMFKII